MNNFVFDISEVKLGKVDFVFDKKLMRCYVYIYMMIDEPITCL